MKREEKIKKVNQFCLLVNQVLMGLKQLTRESEVLTESELHHVKDTRLILENFYEGFQDRIMLEHQRDYPEDFEQKTVHIPGTDEEMEAAKARVKKRLDAELAGRAAVSELSLLDQLDPKKSTVH